MLRRNPSRQPFTWQAYLKLAGKDPRVPLGEVFRLLGQVQDAFGCIPRRVVANVACRSGLSEARLYGALTAYPGFQLHPEK